MKKFLHNKKVYKIIFTIDIVLIILLFLYLWCLKRYMNDYMYYILSIYIPIIAIVLFLCYLIYKIKWKTSLFLILINISILYISFRYLLLNIYDK